MAETPVLWSVRCVKQSKGLGLWRSHPKSLRLHRMRLPPPRLAESTHRELNMTLSPATIAGQSSNRRSLTMKCPWRICPTFGLLQKRRDCFERNAVEVIDDDIQSFIDKTVALVALLFEAIAFALRNLPNCIFALHRAPASVKRAKSRAPFCGRFNCSVMPCA